ncbi:hypothetical protein ACQPZJ_11565 [Actinoplanes sp. CA-054009]
MLDDLEAVAWGELSHAYGPAGDTSEFLRRAGDDADPEVCEAAAYAAVKAGAPAGPLWRRWALALGAVDPGPAGTVLAGAARGGHPAIRMAAAVALPRAGLAWPEGTIPALVAPTA